MTEVSREEFAMLRGQVADNARRIDEIDRTGTRGVGVLAVQVSELSKDMGGLQATVEKHQLEHLQDQKDRRRARAQVIGWGIAVFAALESPIITLLITRGR